MAPGLHERGRQGPASIPPRGVGDADDVGSAADEVSRSSDRVLDEPREQAVVALRRRRLKGANALPLPPTPRRLPRLRPTSLRRLAPNLKPRRPPLLSPAPTRLTLLLPNKRMLRRPLLLARERAFPLSKIGGRLPRRPKRHARTMQRRQRSANAPRHPPSRSRRHQLRADPLLRLARNPGFRLQLI